MITIKTDHKPRQMLCFLDLPEKWQSEFDYIEESDKCSARFVFYKRWVYDVFDSMRINHPMSERVEFKGWHGYQPDSYFSGTLFKIPEDEPEAVICGWWHIHRVHYPPRKQPLEGLHTDRPTDGGLI